MNGFRLSIEDIGDGECHFMREAVAKYIESAQPSRVIRLLDAHDGLLAACVDGPGTTCVLALRSIATFCANGEMNGYAAWLNKKADQIESAVSKATQ